jgi:hypothetical protein
VAREHTVAPGFGVVIGDGPVYPAGQWVHGTVSIARAGNDRGWYDLNVLWVARPEYTGPILIRGQQIDGAHGPLLFGNSLTGQDMLAELEFSAGTGGSNPGGWGEWPSYTMPRTAGCYAYQVDGSSFSTVIAFQVVT